MKNNSNRAYQFLGILAITLVGYSCTQEIDYSKTRETKIPESKAFAITDSEGPNTQIFEEYDKLIKEYKEGVFVTNWTYDENNNDVIFSKKENRAAAMEGHNHRLGLAFKEHIATENPKTLKYLARSVFARMTETGPYTSVLKINGEPYSGIVIGTHLGSGKRILEIQFYEGIRVGNFKVWTDLNRLYSKSFKQNLVILDIESVRKPIIYLYPEQAQDINVKVHFKGEFTHTYPKYPEAKGWNVKASPDGMLTDKTTGKQYSYLFWEGVSPFKYNLDQGFVVKGEKIANFLDEKLKTLGLNRREATDFITYWLPELEKNPYNLIHFSSEEYCQNAPLEISPAPETLIRVFMVYQPLETAINLPAQQLTKVTRKGYTVVEWGGKRAKQVLN